MLQYSALTVHRGISSHFCFACKTICYLYCASEHRGGSTQCYSGPVGKRVALATKTLGSDRYHAEWLVGPNISAALCGVGKATRAHVHARAIGRPLISKALASLQVPPPPALPPSQRSPARRACWASRPPACMLANQRRHCASRCCSSYDAGVPVLWQSLDQQRDAQRTPQHAFRLDDPAASRFEESRNEGSTASFRGGPRGDGQRGLHAIAGAGAGHDRRRAGTVPGQTVAALDIPGLRRRHIQHLHPHRRHPGVSGAVCCPLASGNTHAGWVWQLLIDLTLLCPVAGVAIGSAAAVRAAADSGHGGCICLREPPSAGQDRRGTGPSWLTCIRLGTVLPPLAAMRAPDAFVHGERHDYQLRRAVAHVMQKPAEEEVFRAQQQQPDQRRQWGLPPPPTADFNQWSGSAEADDVRRWQPTEPPPASWQEVRVCAASFSPVSRPSRMTVTSLLDVPFAGGVPARV